MNDPSLVNVTGAKYAASAVKRDQWPRDSLPEIAFIGRSNVGKSSLINSLTRTNNLARTSKQPGKTRTLNYFEVTLKLPDGGRQKFFLVDLPGYGYAKVAKAQREVWQTFINDYLLHSPRLRFVCLLVDIRHEPMGADVEKFRWLVANRVPVLVIATKADKLGKSAAAKSLAALRRALADGDDSLDVLPYSAVSGAGRAELLAAIAAQLPSPT